MAGIDLFNTESPLLSLLQQSVFDTNLYRKFNAVDTLISALPDDVSERIFVRVYENPSDYRKLPKNAKRISLNAKQFKVWLNRHLLKNVNNKAKLEKISILKENVELAIEYLGQDYLTHPEFHYDKEFEMMVAEINFVVNHFVGLLIKELQNTGDIDKIFG